MPERGKSEFDREYETNSHRAHLSAYVLIAGLIFEMVNAIIWFRGIETIAEMFAVLLIVGGVWGEVFFGHRARIAGDKQLAQFESRTAEANERAANADLARAKLESRLQPRSINREQWDLIHGLRGKFESINIAYETDAETQWFASQLQGAFISAKIAVRTVGRAAGAHTFGNMIFEPKGFDGANPRTVGPLIELFKDAETFGALAIVTALPSDIQAPTDVPMIIVGARFVVTPSHIANARSGNP
jgi:hypothetical protein